MTQYEKMTQTSEAPLIAKLAVPSVMTMLVTNIYNLADTAFVGQLGKNASGAVGVVFSFMTIIQAIGFLFGQGAGSIISRLLGRRVNEQANVMVSTAFFFSFCSGLVLALVSAALLDPLVHFLGSTITIAPYARTYILVATPFMTVSFTMNQILRYEGKAALGMVGMMVSFFILLSIYLRGKSLSRPSWKMVSFEPRLFCDIVATGLPSLLRQGLNSVTTMMLNTQARAYGDAAISAISIVNRIIHFVFSMALGIGHGFQPVSGFNYGAGKYSRVCKAFRTTVIMAETVVGVIVVFLILFSGKLIGIFINDSEVIEIGTRALRIQSLALLLLPFSSMTEMLYQSTGNKLGASVLSVLRGGVILIPAIFILSQLRGLYGIEEAQAVAYVMVFFPSLAFVRRFFQKLPKEDVPDEAQE